MQRPRVRGADPGDLVGSTVLVTGGAGFIGHHLVDALAPIADVRVLDHCDGGRATAVHDDATLAVGDVTDTRALADAVDDADVVFHLAAVSSVPDAMADPVDAVDVNVAATTELLERATAADARVVFASSAAIYGRPDRTPIPEDHRTDPVDPYGVSKLAGDQLVRGYHDWFDADTIALRFFNVYGSGQRTGVVPAFVERASAGDPLVVHGDGEQTRDFVHVDDVVQAMVAAATADASGVAVNVGTGEATSVRELAERVRAVADADVDVVHDDPRPADIDASCASVERAASLLGFEASTSLEEGLRSVLEHHPARD